MLFFFSQQQHLTTLIITRKLGCIRAERNHKQLLAPRSRFLSGCIFISHNYTKQDSLCFFKTQYQLFNAEFIKFKCREFPFGFKKGCDPPHWLKTRRRLEHCTVPVGKKTKNKRKKTRCIKPTNTNTNKVFALTVCLTENILKCVDHGHSWDIGFLCVLSSCTRGVL